MEKSKILKTMDRITRTHPDLSWCRTAVVNFLERDGVQMFQNYVNSSIDEAIAETVDIFRNQESVC